MLSKRSGTGVKKKLMIAVSGKSGCGNTTVSRIVAERLGLKFINFTFRSMAEETGISLKDVLDLASKDDSWDKEVDRRQLALADESSGCVLGSRLAIWMLKDADLKVYLRADTKTRVARIKSREGGSTEEIASFTAERDQRDRNRYMRIYGIDNDNYAFADMIIDTDSLDPEKIAETIIEAAMNIGKK